MSDRDGKKRADNRTKARIDSKYLRTLIHPEESVEKFAKRCDISKSKIHEILHQEDNEYQNPYVLIRSLRKISSSTHVPINNLIYYGEGTLPNDVTFYEQLRFGWYIDNPREQADRKDSGGENPADTWLREEINLRHSTEDTNTFGHLAFRGTSTNCLDYKFDLWAELLTPFLFVVRSVGRKVGKDTTRSWTGVFHRATMHQICGKDECVTALCGLWTGVHVGGDIGVYRWLVADQALSMQQVREVAAEHSVRIHLDSDSQHSSIG